MDEIIINNCKFATKLAISDKEQTKGLMFTYDPLVMCFPFKKAEIKKFWMKNTKIPLDIVFCASNKIIAIEKGNPDDLTFVGPNLPVNLVIELPYGTCKKNNINVGDAAYIKYSVQSLAKKFSFDLESISNRKRIR